MDSLPPAVRAAHSQFLKRADDDEGEPASPPTPIASGGLPTCTDGSLAGLRSRSEDPPQLPTIGPQMLMPKRLLSAGCAVKPSQAAFGWPTHMPPEQWEGAMLSTTTFLPRPVGLARWQSVRTT